MTSERAVTKGLLGRLEQGAVVCAEGYLFEFERRGYLQAGAFVPEVVLEHPEMVAQLHREFVHAGSDVVEAFTYYAHREKLRLIGRESDLEPLNRNALAVAKEVAEETGSLLAGNVSNTNVFLPDDDARREVRRMFDEQIAWAVDAGVDFVIGETFSWVEEAAIAREADELGVRYLGVCCGAGPHHIRAVAEAVGRQPPASRFSPDMSKHAFLGTDAALKAEYQDYAE